MTMRRKKQNPRPQQQQHQQVLADLTESKITKIKKRVLKRQQNLNKMKLKLMKRRRKRLKRRLVARENSQRRKSLHLIRVLQHLKRLRKQLSLKRK